MLNGSWTISAPDPARPDPDDSGYLPPGTRLRLRLAGPTRQSLEEGRHDQLGGQATLEPPVAPTLCASPLGQVACGGGRLLDRERLSFDAAFTFFNWTAAQAADPANAALAEAGARKSAPFVAITLQGSDVTWTVWMRGRDELVGQYLGASAAGAPVVRLQHWRRAKETP